MSGARPNSLVAEATRSVKSEMIGVAVFSAVINLLMLTGPLFMLQVYDRVLTSRSTATLVALVILILMLFGFMAVLDAIRARVLSRIGLKVDAKLRNSVFDAIVTAQLTRRSISDGQQPLRDLDTIRTFMGGQGPIVLFDLPWMPLYMLLVFLLHPWLGLLACAGAVVVVVLTLVTEMKSREPMQKATQELGRRNAWTEGSRRNAEVLKALGMSKAIRDRWVASHSAASVEQVTGGDSVGGVSAITKAFRLFLQSALLGLGAYLVIIGQASGGVMIASSIIAARALAPVEQAIAQWRGFVAFRQARTRLEQLLMAPAPARTSLPTPMNHVTLTDVAVAPPGARVVTLMGMNFTLKAGDGVAVIGPSAAGKSTLARAMVGVWPVVRGELRIDGATFDQWAPDQIGQMIGYLPQAVELFDGTVAANIARFAPDAEGESIVKAAQAAGAHEMILKLPEGYDTQIGEQGVTLSAGQRQRIGLARALYGEPFLVVLDEPNANLDAEGETALMKAVRSVRDRGGVVVVMAHRPSALAEVDLVLVIKDGKQVMFGPKDEVLKKAVANPEVAGRSGGVKVA
ncbi:MAG: type I secretion system permease/ATPase [Hyphomicrobiaceae bacterium]|nr:type I secretion system permease/ATPase [Hyphomicrobiaceae bacterium]